MFKIKTKKNQRHLKKVLQDRSLFFAGALLLFLVFSQNAQAVEIPHDYLKKIELRDRIYTQELDIATHRDFFDIYTKYYYKNQEVKFASGSTLAESLLENLKIEKREIMGINRGAILDYIHKELVPKYNLAMSPVRIYRNAENQKIQFDGFAMDGRKIQANQLADLITYAIQNEVHIIKIPFEIEPAKVTVEDEELKNLGIKELIATGESDYSYSSWRRITNIKVGSSSFNGKLLQKDEVFSIGRELGAITVAKGYQKELVIKGTETIPELGGGLCQVATTAFRGALLGGFEIIERWQHAYAVFHYEPFGSDATIYPPIKDFKFKNNTPAALLIQTHLDEAKEILYVNYFGTKDLRIVNVFGPFVSHWKYAGAKKYETDPNKKYWQKRILNESYNGFSVSWFREVMMPQKTGTGGEVLNLTGATVPVYEFNSVYRPAF